jgi:hypothetical protein
VVEGVATVAVADIVGAEAEGIMAAVVEVDMAGEVEVEDGDGCRKPEPFCHNLRR